MRDVVRLLRIIHSLVRVFGFAPFNDKGNLSRWYAVTCFHTVNNLILLAMYWYRVATIKTFYSTRPFQLMLAVVVSLTIVGGMISNVRRIRNPVPLSDLLRTERLLRIRIDYDVRFLIVDLILITVARMVHTGVMFHQFYIRGIVPLGPLIVVIFSKYFYETLLYVGMTYYCLLMQILRQQLKCLKPTLKERVKYSYLHNHLLSCCTSIHRSYRIQIMFYVFHATITLIWDLVYAHERTLGFVNNDNSFIQCILSVVSVIFRIHELHNVFWTGYVTRKSANTYLNESYLLLQKKRKFEDKLLKAYVVSRPAFNHSVGGYLSATLGNLISIVSACGLYYFLMVQLNVIRSKYY